MRSTVTVNRLTLGSLLAAAALAATSLHATPGRVTQSLDGQWQVEDSMTATEPPTTFTHTVPRLANLAKPAFPDVDKFISRENLADKIRSKLAPTEWLTNYWKG